MAHKIETYDKQEGIEMGWHGLTTVRPVITLDDNWLTTWDVVPVVLEKRGKASRYCVLEATDVPELEIGKAYNTETFTPVSNKDFLELVRQSIAGTSHSIASVGSVRNRGRVFVSLKLNGMETFEAAGRKFSAYLNFGNGHDKSSVLWANTSNTCTVCDNTFSFNLFSVENKENKDKENTDDLRIRLRHTKKVVLKLPDVAKLIEGAIGVQAEFKAAMDSLASVEISKPAATNLFAGFIGRKIQDTDAGLSTRAFNTVNRMVTLFESGKGNNGRNMADAVSAVTDFYTHESSGKEVAPMRQYLSSEYGSGLTAKTDFWNMASKPDALTNIDQCIARGATLLAHTAI